MKELNIIRFHRGIYLCICKYTALHSLVIACKFASEQPHFSFFATDLLRENIQQHYFNNEAFEPDSPFNQKKFQHFQKSLQDFDERDSPLTNRRKDFLPQKDIFKAAESNYSLNSSPPLITTSNMSPAGVPILKSSLKKDPLVRIDSNYSEDSEGGLEFDKIHPSK